MNNYLFHMLRHCEERSNEAKNASEKREARRAFLTHAVRPKGEEDEGRSANEVRAESIQVNLYGLPRLLAALIGSQ